MALVAFETPSVIALPVAFAASIVALVAFETPSVIALPVAFAAFHCGVSCIRDRVGEFIHCSFCCT